MLKNLIRFGLAGAVAVGISAAAPAVLAQDPYTDTAGEAADKAKSAGEATEGAADKASETADDAAKKGADKTKDAAKKGSDKTKDAAKGAGDKAKDMTEPMR